MPQNRKYAPEEKSNDFDILYGGAKLQGEELKKTRLQLKANPNNLRCRLRLLGRGYIGSRGSYIEHLTWLIEHHPRRGVHTLIVPRKNDDFYKAARAVWMRQVRTNPSDVTILVHAAEYLSTWSQSDAIRILKRASELDPTNEDIPLRLSSVYGGFQFERTRKNLMLARKAVEQLKIAIKIYSRPNESDSYLLPYFTMVVGDLAERVLLLRMSEEARELAQICMNHQKINARRLNAPDVAKSDHPAYRLSKYRAHAILGLADLVDGNVTGAKKHLRSMMKLQKNLRSRQNYVLVSRLEELGETEIVLEYLTHCQKEFEGNFESPDDQRYAEETKNWLGRWIKRVKKGELGSARFMTTSTIAVSRRT